MGADISRQSQGGHARGGTLKPGMGQPSCRVSSHTAGEEAAGAAELEEAMEKLLLPPAAAAAPSPSATGGNSPGRIVQRCLGTIHGDQRPRRRHSQSLGTASSSGCDRGRKRRRRKRRTRWRDQKVQAVPSCRAAPRSRRRGGCTPGDRSGSLDACRSLEAGAGQGEARLSRLARCGAASVEKAPGGFSWAGLV